MRTIKTIKTKQREEGKLSGCMWHFSSSDDLSVCIPCASHHSLATESNQCRTSFWSIVTKLKITRDLFNPVEKKQKQTQISFVLKAPHPIATLLPPPILITFAGFLVVCRWFLLGRNVWSGWGGGWYCFCRKAPLSISGTNSQQSWVPTPINPT